MKEILSKIKNSKKGASMILAMIVVVVFAFLGAAIWQYSMSSIQQSSLQDDQMQAEYLAKYTAQSVAYYLTNPSVAKSDKESIIGTKLEPMKTPVQTVNMKETGVPVTGLTGTYSIEIIRNNSPTDVDYMVITVTSTATVGTDSATAKLEIWPEISPRIVALGSGRTFLLYSSKSWSGSTYSGSNDMKSAAWGNSKFVAVGTNGYTRTSTNGSTWSSESKIYAKDANNLSNTITINANLNDIIYTGSQFIAIGDSGTILTSSTGVPGDWIKIPSPGPTNLVSIAYKSSPNAHIAVGNGGKISFSEEGSTWTSEFFAIDAIKDNLKKAFWNGSSFIVAGDNKRLLVSPSGNSGTWIDYTMTSGSRSINSIAMYKINGSTYNYIAVCDNGYIRSSNNGIVWETDVVNNASTENLNDIIWSGVKFVAVGNNGTIIESPSGKADSWNKITINGVNTNLVKVVKGDLEITYSLTNIKWKK